MSTPSEFSYSFELGGTPIQTREPALFAIDNLSEFPLPGDKVLARNPRNGRQMVLPDEVINALSYCTAFRTLNEHVEVLLDGGPADPGRTKAVQAVIKSVHDGGLLLSARDVCDRLEPSKQPAPSIGQPIVAIITWERPQALSRLLESLLLNCDQSAIARCIVVDDSRDHQLADRNRTITARANEQAQLNIDYFGAPEAQTFMNQLLEDLPQHEREIRFLLDREAWKDRWTAGIARNYCQLLSVGHPLIVCDDDSVCDVYEAPAAEDGVEFCERTREAVFYPDRSDWPMRAAKGARDPFARHMQVLGLTISQTLTTLGKNKPRQESLTTASTGFATRLSGECRVITTECASIGDPGTGNNRWVATLPPDSRQRLAPDERLLESALRNRNCYLGRMRPAFVPNSNISQITGSDNRDFLPPYFPVMRGQDRVFGETCHFLFPDSVALDMPWASPHLPVEERKWKAEDNDFTRGASFPGDLTSPPATLGDACYPDKLEKRLEFLARYYFDLATCPDQRLLEIWIDDWHHSWSVMLTLLHEQIHQSSDALPAWREYIQNAYRDTRGCSLQVAGVSELASRDIELTGTELVSFWRQAWGNFGHSLLAWNEIRAAARKARDKTGSD